MTSTVLALGCDPGPPPSPLEDNSETLVAHLGRLWPSPIEQGVAVCWETFGDGDVLARERDLVREAIEGTWSREAGIRFVGWGACSPGSPGIHLAATFNPRYGPHCKVLGRKLDGIDSGCILALHVEHLSRDLVKSFEFRPALVEGDLTDEAIAMLAVHEFGHALGFAHEQDGFPEDCAAKSWQDPLHVSLLRRYDEDSVMNYCRPRRFAPRPLEQILSDGDKQAARMLYPLDGRNACGANPCAADTDGPRDRDLCKSGWPLGCVPATGECLRWEGLPEGSPCNGPMYTCVEQSCILTCQNGRFRCADGTACVLDAHVCDDTAQCLDGSDEWDCDRA